MSRVYSCPFDNLSVTTDADQDFWELVNGSTVCVELLEFLVESAYAVDERIRMRLVRRSTTGSGGVAATEVKAESGDASPVAQINHLVTTPGTLSDVIEGYQFSQLARENRLWVPEARIIVPPSGRLALNIQSAVAATRVWSGMVSWREIG